jgi:hypothetical protein
VGEDSKLYSVELEDPSIGGNTDGGYVITRAKYTRKPRRKFKSGFTMMTQEDKGKLETFYELVRGGSAIFTWVDPSAVIPVFDPLAIVDPLLPVIDYLALATYQVRFVGPLAFSYSGVGPTRRWDVEFSMAQP